MKNRIKILITLPLVILFACNDLTLNPLSQGSSETWFTDESELSQSIVALYNVRYWNAVFTQNSYNIRKYGCIWTDVFSDDWTNRNKLVAITNGTINGQTNFVGNTWKYAYECIANANQIIVNIDRAKENLTEERLKMYEANARFIRASQYAKLIFYYGDVPYYENVLDIDEAFTTGRTPKGEILQHVYADFDYAINNLPIHYSNSELMFATKGAALAMKARTALYMGDYATTRDAAKACINLEEYSLYPDFSAQFLIKTGRTSETVFSMPRSVELGVTIDPNLARQPQSRSSGFTAYIAPSWELLCSFLCTDGLPIDESPLFNPRKPFENRDPRCTATIVEFGTEWLGFIYTPHPDTMKVLNVKTGIMQNNRDNKAVDRFASFNGLLWKKGLDEEWLTTPTAPDNVIIRYADVLLMYAEAKIELNDIDQSVLDAINDVRARAYKVDKNETSLYPAVTSTSQSELRKIVRIERRMELAFEGLRYNDLIRWKLAEKSLTRPIYGLLDPTDLREKVVNQGLWFFSAVPEIDEDGVADFSALYNSGTIKLLANRSFDKSKQYLWPLPTSEILINDNLVQNPNY